MMYELTARGDGNDASLVTLMRIYRHAESNFTLYQHFASNESTIRAVLYRVTKEDSQLHSKILRTRHP
jgi:hypothetical protein